MRKPPKPFVPFILVLAALLAGPQHDGRAAEPTAALKAVIEAARTEGALNLSYPQSVVGGTSGVRQIEAQMNALFGTNIRIKFAPAQSLERQGQQLILEHSAGQKAHTDIYIARPSSLMQPVERGVFMEINWRELLPDRIRPEFVESHGRLLRLGVTFPVIVYNTQRAPMVPKTLEDMLRPEWKGKFAAQVVAAGFEILAAEGVWGREKTLAFVRRLSEQAGGLIRCGAEVERGAAGEYAALAMDCIAGNTMTWQERGAPVESVIPGDAAELHYYYLTVPKAATYPNAAKLFAVFMLSEVGQKLNWDTWKIDLDGLPDSKMDDRILKLKHQGTAFTEVTMDWWLKHPEVPELMPQLIKLLAKN